MAAPQVSSFLPVGMMHSPGFDGGSSLSFQMLMNADSLYSAAHCALLLNLKLFHGDYYRKRPTLPPGMMVSMSSGMSFPLGELSSTVQPSVRSVGRNWPVCSVSHCSVVSMPMQVWRVEIPEVKFAQ